MPYGFNCTKGWDPATGWGTPIFTALLKAALAAGEKTVQPVRAPDAGVMWTCGFNCGTDGECDCTDWNNSTSWCGQSSDNCVKGCGGQQFCPSGQGPNWKPFYTCGYGCGSACPSDTNKGTCDSWDKAENWCGQAASHCTSPKCKNGLWCPNGQYPK